MGDTVSFEVLARYERKAREIDGITAFGSQFKTVSANLTCEATFIDILQVCGGLPLALAIAGSGIKSHFDNSDSAAFAVNKYWTSLRDCNVPSSNKTNDAHPGLEHVVSASLKECERWGRSCGRHHEMNRMFESLCVLEKQTLITESALKSLWELGEREVGEVIGKFADCNIVHLEPFSQNATSDETVYNYGVRLHDLVLMLCREMAGPS